MYVWLCCPQACPACPALPAVATFDRESCELVHIDFSVCFDKGSTLSVPEVVPFRLTQMMQVGTWQLFFGMSLQATWV